MNYSDDEIAELPWLMRWLFYPMTRTRFWCLMSAGPAVVLVQLVVALVWGKPWSWIAPALGLVLYGFLMWLVVRLMKIGALRPVWAKRENDERNREQHETPNE